jgi:hypothetical protein
MHCHQYGSLERRRRKSRHSRWKPCRFPNLCPRAQIEIRRAHRAGPIRALPWPHQTVATRFHFSVIIAQQSADAAASRRIGAVNGSRERAPDDELRDTHQLQFTKMIGFAERSPPLPESSARSGKLCCNDRTNSHVALLPEFMMHDTAIVRSECWSAFPASRIAPSLLAKVCPCVAALRNAELTFWRYSRSHSVLARD